MIDTPAAGAAPACNADPATLASFGSEWRRFPQIRLSQAERQRIFASYFAIFPWDQLPPGGGCGADIGCGSGRWAAVLAPRVRQLHVVDASPEVLGVARRALAGMPQIVFHQASVDRLPFADASLDFAYSLGVLHHVPDPEAAIRSIAATLKPGAPLLVYLYYDLETRPRWYRRLWRISDSLRRWTGARPGWLKLVLAEAFAFGVYLPLAQAARWLHWLGCLPAHWPLAYYRDKSLYVMRTDALDRLGTPLEQRFSRAQIQAMLSRSGLEAIRFSDRAPFWCAVASKPALSPLGKGEE